MAKQVYENDVYIGREVPVQVLFPPALNEPRKASDDATPKYEIQIGFPEDHPDYLELKKITAKIAREKFGSDVNIRQDLNLKFVNGDDEFAYYADPKRGDKAREYPQLKGKWIMKLRSKNPIAVFDARQKDNKGRPLEITGESMEKTIFAGALVAMRLTAATYDAINPKKGDKPGVTFYPEEVCMVQDTGERFGGGNIKDGSGFAAVQGQISDEDPTSGMELDDDIPF